MHTRYRRSSSRRALPVAVFSALVVGWSLVPLRAAPEPGSPPAPTPAPAPAAAVPTNATRLPAVILPSELVLNRVRSTRIPTVIFREAGLEGVLLTLTDLSAAYSPNGVGMKFVVLPDKDKALPNPAITLDLRNVTLAEILGAICRQHGFSWDAAPGLVYLKPTGVETPATYMETRSYQAPRATLIRILGPEVVGSHTPSSL